MTNFSLHFTVPTAKLVDLSSPPHHQNGVNRNGKNGIHHHDNDPGSSGSSTSTLTGQRGPIPLTIKQFEVDSRRKTLLAEAAAVAANAKEAKNPLECWDYVYRYTCLMDFMIPNFKKSFQKNNEGECSILL